MYVLLIMMIIIIIRMILILILININVNINDRPCCRRSAPGSPPPGTRRPRVGA